MLILYPIEPPQKSDIKPSQETEPQDGRHKVVEQQTTVCSQADSKDRAHVKQQTDVIHVVSQVQMKRAVRRWAIIRNKTLVIHF